MVTTEELDCSFQDFEQQDLIGSGGNADVYKSSVDMNGDEQIVAMKSPRMTEYDTVDTSFFDEFIEEAEIWAQIDEHENIVSVLDWGSNPYPWIALEYMDGGNLAEATNEYTLEQRADIFEQICNGVFYAHRHGITHSDLKPANVLLTTDQKGNIVAKVGDWGLANVLLEHSQTTDEMTLGYSSPEQVDKDKYGSTDDRTDIYQLGVIAFELFTDEELFESENTAQIINDILNATPPDPSGINDDLPTELDEVILRALKKNKEDRYETVTHLRDGVIDAIRNSSSTSASHVDNDTSSSSTEQLSEPQSQTTSPTESSNSQHSSPVADESQLASSSSSSVTTENDRPDDAEAVSTANTDYGVWGRFRTPISDISFRERNIVGDMMFSFEYARTMDESTIKRGGIAFLLGIMYLGTPLLVGYVLDVIQQSATSQKGAPEFQWGRTFKYGLISGVLAFAGLVVAILPGSMLGADSLSGLGLLVWIYITPAFVVVYGITRDIQAALGSQMYKLTLTTEYLGMFVGGSVLFTIGYFATALSFITIIGGFFVGFVMLTALAAFMGRRCADFDLQPST